MSVAADQYRAPDAVSEVAAIAARLFARHNVEFSGVRRAGGWTNATWVGGGLALRVSVETGTDHLLREAQLASLLPPAVGYPPIIEAGVMDSHHWLLTREVAGRNLGEVWPTLGWEARIDALRQLWAKAQAVHEVDISAAAAYTRKVSPFYAPDPEAAAASLTRLEGKGILASQQTAVLQDALDRFWAVWPAALRRLNHGDLSIENALWNDGQIVALLDFEFAVIAPVELDLNEILKCAYAPPEKDDPLPDVDGAGLKRLQKAAADMASATVVTREGADLLLGYAVLLELWSMENWLAKWDGVEPMDQWQPYRTLMALAHGAGGYLAPVLARIHRNTN